MNDKKLNKVNIPAVNQPRVVIVGGGFGGITLAKALRKYPVQVVLLDKNNYHTFQPLLYQVATGGLEPDSIAFPIRKMFKKQQNFFFRMAEVEYVDTDAKRILTSIGQLAYDYLVLATGSTTNFFGLDNVAKATYGLKNIPEALDLRSLILQQFEAAVHTDDLQEREALMNFVVVGGGPTGVETAGALCELKKHILPNDYPELDLRRMQVHLVEASDRVLNGMQPKSSHNAMKALKKMGVQLWMDTQVKDYKEDLVIIENGKNIPARTVIWAAGVGGEAPEGLKSSKQHSGRLKVDAHNRLEGVENVFAIGDVAQMEAEAYPKGHPMVAPVAIQQAQLLAKNLRNLMLKRPLTPFIYKDKGSMATIGRNKAVVETKRFNFKGWFAWLAWMGVHLFSLAGFRNRLVVFINWFWNYITYDRGTRLIIRRVKEKPSGH